MTTKPDPFSAPDEAAAITRRYLVGFLWGAVAISLGSAVVWAVTVAIVMPTQPVRYVGPILATLLAGLVWIPLRKGRQRSAAIILAGGAWLLTTVQCLLAGGVRTPIAVIYPLLIIFLGWQFSLRLAVWLAGLTMFALLAMVVAESQGLFSWFTVSPPVMYLTSLSTSVIAAAILVVNMVRAYREQLERQRRLAEVVTERGSELERSRSELARAQAVGRIGSWVFDIGRDEMRLSDETCRIFGVPAGTVASMGDYLARTHEADVARLREAWVQALKGAAFDHEHRVVIGDEVRWIRQIAEFERDATGRAIGAVGVTQDITERKRYETDIVDGRNRLQATLDAVPDLMFELDGEGRFLNVHARRPDLLFLPPERFLGRTVREVLPPDAVAISMAAVAEAERNGHSAGHQFALEMPAGRCWYELSVARKAGGEDGKPHFIVLSRDITERKAIEQQLRTQQQQLEEMVAERTRDLASALRGTEAASRAKSAFLATISHEIRTPMNAITGLSYLLRRGGATPEQAKRLEQIDAATQRLLSVINDILAVASSEADTPGEEIQDFSLGGLLERVVSQIAEDAQAKDISIAVERAGVPDALRGAPELLCRALGNYANNAVKFSDSGTVTLGVRVLGESGDGLWLRFEVSDCGRGIPQQQLAGLFQAFSQGDASMTRRHGGAGLGLAVTRRIVESLGGEVGAESTPGSGSRFWFRLRLQRASDALRPLPPIAGESARELHQKRAGARILLVEDNEVNRDVALELLRAVGLTVEHAGDGRRALDMAGERRFDLVLMDMQMPGMDGIEATRAIRAIPGCADLPILALTANAFDEDRRSCLDAGMNDFLAKPLNPNQLYAALLRWLPRWGEEAVPPAPPERAANASGTDTLPEIPGVDIAHAMTVLRGNAGSYRRLALLFARSHREDAAKLRDARSAGQDEEVRRIAHALKGSAGSIGAIQLAELAARVDAQLREGRPVASCQPVDSLAEEIDKVTTGMLAALA